MIKFTTNEDRFRNMMDKVDDIRILYMNADVYTVDDSVSDDEEEEEEETEEEEKEEECDTGGKPKKKAQRYYYFGGLLYPTKNDRHYKILQRIPSLGCSYSMVFHYKEFQNSLKRIHKNCFMPGDGRFVTDILEMKSKGEKFFDLYNEGREIRLIEPHVHFLLRWDNKISVANMAAILNLEPNLIKFKATNGKFLQMEFNALNYQLHLGRAHFKFKKSYFMDLNTDFSDDMQDRCDYDIEEIVACSKWYKILLSQVDEFTDLRNRVISDFTDYLAHSQHFIRRYMILAWFSDKPLYLPYWTSNKQYVRADLIKMVDEHNQRFMEDLHLQRGV